MKTGDRNGGDPIERLQAGALAHRRPQKTRGCPDEDRLRLLLPGQLEPEEADELLTHAAECDWCGTVLREAAQDVTGPPTDEEEKLAGKARLADPRSRRQLVDRIVPPKRTDGPWHLILRWWPAAGLAVAALAGVVGYPIWARSPAHTERLLADAYTKHRQMEMRVPGAKWGPVRTQMGTESSSFNQPVELTDAVSNIKRGIDAHPDDPTWLQLQGRADLLDGKDEAAIVELERAHALRPADASILLDWGTALFEKAEKTDPKLRADAFERFSEGYRLKPDDPALLFNRALAAQRIPVYNEARDDWEKYLRIDPTSGWAQEARQHLNEVKKNLSGSGPTPPRPAQKR
jgi:cytochrome c-type biogenesis protein CcmH/NrfG